MYNVGRGGAMPKMSTGQVSNGMLPPGPVYGGMPMQQPPANMGSIAGMAGKVMGSMPIRSNQQAGYNQQAWNALSPAMQQQYQQGGGAPGGMMGGMASKLYGGAQSGGMVHAGGTPGFYGGAMGGAMPQYQQAPQPFGTMTPYNAPNTGLVGSEQALQGGFDAAMAALGSGGAGGRSVGADYRHINQNRDMSMGQVRQGVDALQPMIQQGQQAGDQQAALSGALGPAAQAQAYANFQSSPGQQWLQEQAERGLLRNQAAIGGLGGGNVRQALQRQAMGLAQQDFQNQYNRLGGLADRGVQGLGYQSNLYGQGAQAASNAGQQGAGVQSSAIGANASLGAAGINARNALQRDAANYAMRAGELTAQGRTNAGSALAALYNAQGAGMGDLYNAGMGNMANVLAGGGENQFASDTARAGQLSNIGLQGSQLVAGLGGIPGIQQNAGLGRNIGESRQAMHDATKAGGDAMQSWMSVFGGMGGGMGG